MCVYNFIKSYSPEHNNKVLPTIHQIPINLRTSISANMTSTPTTLNQIVNDPSVMPFGAPWPPSKPPQFRYSVLPEYFLQTETADPAIFDFVRNLVMTTMDCAAG